MTAQISKVHSPKVNVKGTTYIKVEFITKPFMREAVELRKFDDLAKELNKITPPIEHFQHYVEASLR